MQSIVNGLFFFFFFLPFCFFFFSISFSFIIIIIFFLRFYSSDFSCAFGFSCFHFLPSSLFSSAGQQSLFLFFFGFSYVFFQQIRISPSFFFRGNRPLTSPFCCSCHGHLGPHTLQPGQFIIWCFLSLLPFRLFGSDILEEIVIHRLVQWTTRAKIKKSQRIAGYYEHPSQHPFIVWSEVLDIRYF